MFVNKIKNFGRIFFCAFVFLLPWQTRFIFTPDKSEFLTLSIYLSEIFLWLALTLWLTSADLKKIKIPPVLLIFCFLVFLSIAWSSDKVAAFRLWLFIFDGIMVYLFLREHNELRQTAIKVFLFSMFLASLFGIWQFFNLGSPAEKWLGLAARGAWNLGDIVVEPGGARWLRTYGPLPHPNIFGGYLAAAILLLFNYRVSDIRQYWKYFLSGVFFFALFLTFSRSAWLALAAGLIYFLIKNISRKNLKIFSFLLLLSICLAIIFYPFVKTRTISSGRLEIKSNTERVGSWRDGLAAWYQNPFFGSGIGNNIYIWKSDIRIAGTPFDRYTAWLKESTKPEPPHNIFILALSQLGLVGFLIYLFLWSGFWKNPVIRPFLILFFIIGMLDHYLWTLWPGQILFWTTLAFFSNVDGGGQNGPARN